MPFSEFLLHISKQNELLLHNQFDLKVNFVEAIGPFQRVLKLHYRVKARRNRSQVHQLALLDLHHQGLFL